MMSDDTLTPTEAETASNPAEDAGMAPETNSAAAEPPVTNEEPAEAHEAHGEAAPMPEEPAEPVAETPAEVIPETQQEPSKPEPPQPDARSAAVNVPDKAEVDRSEDARLFDAAMSALGSGEDLSEGTYKKLSRGDRVEATVIQVDRDRVFVDLGTKSEGIVPLGELTEENIEHASDHVKVGDKIQVVVMRPEGAEGNPLVSKRRADFEDAWDRIESSFTEGKTLTALVIDRVKGGLVVDIGVRGFVPATHVGGGKLRNIEKFVGQPLALKIIEIDRDRKKVVLSNRLAEEEKRASAKEDIFNNVSPGDVLEGTVRRLTDYGAFVDLGGVDGLLHISEMSWMRINHPKEMFREGQKIKVMVLRLDAAAGKISLGHRQVLPDPWNLIKETYRVGQRLTTKISRMVMSGAFVKLPEGAEAFIPLSEMSTRRIRRPEDVVEENQEVEVQIIDLRPEDRRMVLSMRATGSSADSARGAQVSMPSSYDDEDRGKRGVGPGGAKRGKKGGKGGGRRGGDDEMEEIVGRRGYATGGATIGERLGMLKGFDLGREEEDDDLAEGEATAEPQESAPVEQTEE
jgi:predicted RNA-binding protein with RPS1 domain